MSGSLSRSSSGYLYMSTKNITNSPIIKGVRDLPRYTVPVTGPVVAQRVGRVIPLLFHDRGTRGG